MFPGITSIRLCERVLKDKTIIKQWDFAGYWPRPILICAFLVLEGLANQYSVNPWSHTCPQHLMYYIDICIQRRVATTPLCPSGTIECDQGSNSFTCSFHTDSKQAYGEIGKLLKKSSYYPFQSMTQKDNKQSIDHSNATYWKHRVLFYSVFN